MKVTGETYKLARGETQLRLDENVCAALRLEESSALYVVSLRHGKDTIFVGSPYPTSSWGNLFRASFILSRASGRLNALIKRLNELRIFCRSIEVMGSLPLDACEFLFDRSEKGSLKGAEKAMVPATAKLVLEVPRLERVQDPDLRALHQQIGSWLKGGAGVVPGEQIELRVEGGSEDALGELRKALEAVCEVEWLSPMRTVGEIWRRARAGRHRVGSGLDRMREIVRRDARGLHVSAEARSSDIWESRRDITDSGHTARVRTEDSLVLIHADSDEKVVLWTVRSLKQACVVGFTVLFPAGGMESAWLEWITGVICKQAGIVLTAELSARKEPASDRLKVWGGRWTSARMVVQFPPLVDEASAARVLHCFKGLQLKVKDAGKAMQTFLKDRKYIMELLAPDLPPNEHWRASTIVTQMTLWHEERFDKLYHLEWWPWVNPFIFTEWYPSADLEADDEASPVRGDDSEDDQWARRMLKDGRGGPSRSILVRRIVRGFTESTMRHVAVIGARRSGKTSILRQVDDALTRSRDAPDWSDKEALIPIFINAAVCSPVHLCIAILKGYAATRDRQGGIVAVNAADALVRVKALQAVYDELATLGHALAKEAPGQPGFAGLGPKRDAFLRDSLDQLIKVVGMAGEHEPPQRMIVLVDEIPAHGIWMEPWAQAFWREMVEAEELRELSWAISTSLSTRETTAFSLISSVFYEFNLGPLDEIEADRLISKIYKWPSAQTVDGAALGTVSGDKTGDKASSGTMPRAKPGGAKPQGVGAIGQGKVVVGVSCNDGATMATGDPSSGLKRIVAATPRLVDRKDAEDDECAEVDAPTPLLTLGARRFLTSVSARMPYLLQVCCYCLFERAKRMRLPVLTSQVAVRVLDDDVLPQLTDYLESEWGRLPEETRRYVLATLAPWPDDPWEMLVERGESDTKPVVAAPPPVEKALLRSGLTGAREFGLVAPLVAFWLQRSGRHVST